MAKYVLLVNWTEQGVQNAKDTVKRSEQVRDLFQRMGVTIEQVYWTAGQYDIVVVLDAPDDESVSAAALAGAMQGNLRTTTLRAFEAEEMQRILDRIK
jgi:uncharacterized protein with GYD domain